MEFLWWCAWGGMHGHFHVQPNYRIEVKLDVIDVIDEVRS